MGAMGWCVCIRNTQPGAPRAMRCVWVVRRGRRNRSEAELGEIGRLRSTCTSSQLHLRVGTREIIVLVVVGGMGLSAARRTLLAAEIGVARVEEACACGWQLWSLRSEFSCSENGPEQITRLLRHLRCAAARRRRSAQRGAFFEDPREAFE